MKLFFALTKVLFNVNFGLSALKYRFRREKDKAPQTVLVGLVVLLSAGGLIWLYSLTMGAAYRAFAGAGAPEAVLVLAFLGVQAFLLVTGVFYMLGVFYHSNDLAALMPLPLKPWQVLGGKFAVVMAYEYLMALPALAPPVILYGAGQHAGFFYWVKALALMLASPCLPMLLASLLALALMRFLGVGRRRDLLAVAGGTLITAAALAANLLLQRYSQSASDPAALASMLAGAAGLVGAVGSTFPPSAWAALALSEAGVTSALYLALSVALSAALLALMLWLAGRTYYTAPLRGAEDGGRRKRAAAGQAASAAAGPVRSLFIREMRLLLRTPAYAMNCLMASLIVPVIIPLSLLQDGESSSGIRALIADPSNSLVVTLAATAMLLLSATINATASTALSREGRTFWMSRLIPVPPYRQVYAKLLAAMAVACAGMALGAVLMVVLLHVNPALAALSLALGALGALPLTVCGMLPDLLKPKLVWTNPYEAVKQNINVLLSMIAGILLLALEALPALLMVVSGLPDWSVYLALAALLAALALAGTKALKALSGRYYKIEI